MTDIRNVCKVFLDFVYENKILPDTIVKILKEKTPSGSYEWDFRKIAVILAYNSNYRKNDRSFDDRDERIAQVAQDKTLWNFEYILWMQKNRNILLSLKDICDDFFHDVHSNNYVEAFVKQIEALLRDCSSLDEANKNKYIEQIASANKITGYFTDCQNRPSVICNYMPKNKIQPETSDGLRIGHIVQNFFRKAIESDRVTDYEIKKLMEMDYCKQVFRTHGFQFPVLDTEKRIKERYYAYPSKRNGTDYYISSQWFADQLPYLKKWLREHGIEI